MWYLESEKKCDYWTLNSDSLKDEKLETYFDVLNKLDSYEFKWEQLFVEILLETGSIVIYPTDSSEKERNEPVLFKIIFRDLMTKYSNLLLLFDESEEAFEVAYCQALQDIADLVSQKLSIVFERRPDATGFVIVDPDMEVLFRREII